MDVVIVTLPQFEFYSISPPWVWFLNFLLIPNSIYCHSKFNILGWLLLQHTTDLATGCVLPLPGPAPGTGTICTTRIPCLYSADTWPNLTRWNQPEFLRIKYTCTHVIRFLPVVISAWCMISPYILCCIFHLLINTYYVAFIIAGYINITQILFYLFNSFRVYHLGA